MRWNGGFERKFFAQWRSLPAWVRFITHSATPRLLRIGAPLADNLESVLCPTPPHRRWPSSIHSMNGIVVWDLRELIVS